MPPKPKHEQIVREQGVTIAIGLIASDGIVFAADREGSDPFQKIDQGKIKGRFVNHPPYNSIMLGGAGSGSHCDAISDGVLDWFSKAHHPLDMSVVETQVRTLNKEFYKEHVLPLSNYPSIERPDYELLIGCKMRNETSLWTSEYLVLNRRSAFAAIGSGKLTALSLLREVYAYIPVISAINLAVYVIGEVKRFVPGCGLETDVLYACNDCEPSKIVGDDAREIEDALRSFNRVLRRADLHRYIGSNLSLDPRTKPKVVESESEQILRRFKELNEKRLKQLDDQRSKQGQ
jgi:20S proteasome alpha/beta subunit